MVNHVIDIFVFIVVVRRTTTMHIASSGEQVPHIVKIAIRLNKVKGEEVLSADLWPTVATVGKEFDSATMEDFAG